MVDTIGQHLPKSLHYPSPDGANDGSDDYVRVGEQQFEVVRML